MMAETDNNLRRKQSTREENTDLLKEACCDPEAFSRLYLLHYNEVFHYCVRRLFDRHRAEDVTSTVFFKVMHNISAFDGKEIDFRSWLLRIATNAVNDHLRDSQRRADVIRKASISTRTESDPIDPSTDELLERKALLKQALLSLKPQYQTVITLRFFENMKLTEIAGCLGKNPSTIRSCLSRATAKLRKKLISAARERGSIL